MLSASTKVTVGFLRGRQLAGAATMKVKDLIERFITEMNGTETQVGVKPFLSSSSHLYALRRLQRTAFAEKDALALADDDYIEHIKERRKTVCAATAAQDLTFWRGVVQYARSAWKDCKGLSLAPLVDAMPTMKRYGLVGKSTPRTRRPTLDEEQKLIEYLSHGDARSEIKVVPVMKFAIISTRRRGEICRMQRGDVDFVAQTYMIRDMKHPTKKKGNHKVFALLPELAEIIRAQPLLTNNPEERVFPYNPISLGMRFTLAKKALGIVNLRFHDLRREAISRYLSRGLPPHKVRLISGHENTVILERVYDKRDPTEVFADLEKLRPANEIPA